MAMPVRLALIVVGTAAYLGLAVLGWGGFAAFFSHPALIALAVGCGDNAQRLVITNGGSPKAGIFG